MEAWREDQLNALLAPDGQDDLFGRIAGMVRALGFEHCAYGVRAPLPLAQPEIVMLNDYPEIWQKRYQDNNSLQVDPTVRQGAASLDAFAWSNGDDPLDPAAAFWEDARLHDITCGVSLPALAANSVRGMLTLTRGGTRLDPLELRARWPQLLWLGQVAHHGLAREMLARWRATSREALSGREVEILRWVAEGHTNRQIAARFNITERTVNFHLNNAMTKLDVGNRTAAAVRAVVLGIIA